MTELEQLLIERACERLAYQYCHWIDHGSAERVAELFTETGVWSSPMITMEGHDALRQGFAARQANSGRKSRHVCSTVLIDVLDKETATGCVYLTLYRDDGDPNRSFSPAQAPIMVGDYRDEYRLTQAGWRIARRDVNVDFMAS